MSGQELPTAASVAYHHDGRRPLYGTVDKFRRLAAARGLAGLASDTKWDELLSHMRGLPTDRWRPQFRAKVLDLAAANARWDGEWCYHPPFPLVSVEWMDLMTRERTHTRRLPSTLAETDHTSWLEAELDRMGFDHLAGRSMVRIFGYSPRDLTLFDEP